MIHSKEVEIPPTRKVLPALGSAADKFAEDERSYLLQYIYFADVRAVGVIAAVAGAMTYYLIQPHKSISVFSLDVWWNFLHFQADRHDVLANLGFLAGAVSLCAIGIAVCPIIWRDALPGRGGGAVIGVKRIFNLIRRLLRQPRSRPTMTHSSITHYLDIAHFSDSDRYIRRVSAIASSEDGLTREKVRECFELATILKEKMCCVFIGFVTAAVALALLFGDLAWDPPNALKCSNSGPAASSGGIHRHGNAAS